MLRAHPINNVEIFGPFITATSFTSEDEVLGWVNDSEHLYANGKVRIDMHKQEQTNGCMFIVDPATPSLDNKAALDNFEPQFIKAIQAEIKAKAKSYIGKMHMITIK